MRFALVFLLALFSSLPAFSQIEQIGAGLPLFLDRIWVKVRSSITVKELADQLSQDKSQLAKLNDVNEDHEFRSGDWLVLPSQSSKKAKQLASIDSSELRRTPPLAPPPEPAQIHFGESIAQVAKRYNLSITELLRRTSRLASPPSRELSGTSNSSNDLEPKPAFGSSESPFSRSLDELVREGLVSPPNRDLVRNSKGIEALPTLRVKRVPWPVNKQLSPREQALLRQIRSESSISVWRSYGQCNYDWSGWTLHKNRVRTTAVDCGGATMRWTVGVSCDRFLVATYTPTSGWSQWQKPAGPDSKSRRGEDEMVAALCANVLPSSN